MNEIIKAIKERRSYRKYDSKEVDQKDIDIIIESGLYAPSAHGEQRSIILQINNKDIREKITNINRKIGGFNESVDPFYGAPVLLIVLADKSWDNGSFDGSLVMQNMMLAAHSLGLGSCWINRAKEEFEMDEFKKMLKDYNIEGEYVGVGHLIVGHIIEKNNNIPQRKENRVFKID